MDPIEIAQGLSRFEGRTAGTDAERRAALWLRDRLRRAGRDADVETEWIRPQWSWVHAGHALIATVGGLLAILQPLAGLLVCAAALISCTLDLLGAYGLLRRLTPERATQNLVSGPTESTRSGAGRVVRLVIVAGYDLPRGGVGRGSAATRASAALQRPGGKPPGRWARWRWRSPPSPQSPPRAWPGWRAGGWNSASWCPRCGCWQRRRC